jgi:hypothetical protein
VAASGPGLDGLDPIATGCSYGAYTVDSEPITIHAPNHYGAVVGWIDLRYSPRCQTNWARARLSSFSPFSVSTTWPLVVRIVGGISQTYHFWIWAPSPSQNSGVVWTDMVYSPTEYAPPGSDPPDCASAEAAIVLNSINGNDLGDFANRGWLEDYTAFGNTGCY